MKRLSQKQESTTQKHAIPSIAKKQRSTKSIPYASTDVFGIFCDAQSDKMIAKERGEGVWISVGN